MVAVRTIMKFIAYCLNCNLLTYKYRTGKFSEQREALSLSVTSINELKLMIEYFNKFPLPPARCPLPLVAVGTRVGTKYLDFKD